MNACDMDHLFFFYQQQIISDKVYCALIEWFTIHSQERQLLLKRLVAKCYHEKRCGFKNTDVLLQHIYNIEDGKFSAEHLVVSDG